MLKRRPADLHTIALLAEQAEGEGEGNDSARVLDFQIVQIAGSRFSNR